MKMSFCKGRFELILEPQDEDKSYIELLSEAMGHLQEWLLMR